MSSPARRLVRRYRRQSRPLYWWLVRFWQRRQFWIRGQGFAFRRRREHWMESLGWLAIFGRSLLKYGAVAVLLTWGLGALEATLRASPRAAQLLTWIGVTSPSAEAAASLLVTFG